MRPAFPRLLAPLTLLVPLSTAQTVHVVPSGGSASALGDTIAAARDGDVVLVEGGSFVHDGFTIDAKGLVVAAIRRPVIIGSTVSIRLTRKDQTVLLSGLTIRLRDRPNLEEFEVIACRGPVYLQDVVVDPVVTIGPGVVIFPVAPFSVANLLTVAHSELVVATRCSFESESAGASAYGATVRSAIFADDSSLGLYATSVRGLTSGPQVEPTGEDGGEALQLRNGSLAFLADCALAGGDGFTGQPDYYPFDPAGDGGDGGDAIELVGSETLRLGGSLAAGAGGSPGCCFGTPSPGAAGQTVRVNGGSDLLFTGTFGLLTGPSFLEKDEKAHFVVRGDPGDTVYLTWTEEPEYDLQYNARGIVVKRGTGRQVITGGGVVGPSGQLQLDLPVPPTLSFSSSNLVLHVQALRVPVMGTPTLTNPWAVAMIADRRAPLAPR